MRGVGVMRAVAVLLVFSGAASAETRSVAIRNGAAETLRAIQIGPAGNLGENRMRSQLPPGAEARITYSTGCQADVRLTYASGRTEDHAGVNICGDVRIVAGQDGVAGPVVAAAPVGAAAGGAGASGAVPKPGTLAAVPASTPVAAKAPVPPWTGKSITRRFGGLD